MKKKKKRRGINEKKKKKKKKNDFKFPLCPKFAERLFFHNTFFVELLKFLFLRQQRISLMNLASF